MSRFKQADGPDYQSQRADVAVKLSEKQSRHFTPDDDGISDLEEWASADRCRLLSSVGAGYEEEELPPMSPINSCSPNDREFPTCLSKRQVLTKPSRPKTRLTWVNDLIDVGPRETARQSDEDARWKDDCLLVENGNELMMLATMGMSILDRFFVCNTGKLAFALSSLWAQATLLPSTSRRPIKRAMPDITMGFEPSQAFDENYLSLIASELCSSPDGQIHFPFFMVELKSEGNSHKVAELQNLNNASVALHLMYQWWSAAGREKAFFDQVWVVTAIMTPMFVRFRSHWCALTNGQVRYEYAKMGVTFINESPGEAKKVFKKIYSDFGIQRVLPRLQEVVEQVVTKSDTTGSSSVSHLTQELASSPRGKRRAPVSSTSGIDTDADQSGPDIAHPKVAPKGRSAKKGRERPKSRKARAAATSNPDVESSVQEVNLEVDSQEAEELLNRRQMPKSRQAEDEQGARHSERLKKKGRGPQRGG